MGIRGEPLILFRPISIRDCAERPVCNSDKAGSAMNLFKLVRERFDWRLAKFYKVLIIRRLLPFSIHVAVRKRAPKGPILHYVTLTLCQGVGYRLAKARFAV